MKSRMALFSVHRRGRLLLANDVPRRLFIRPRKYAMWGVMWVNRTVEAMAAAGLLASAVVAELKSVRARPPGK
jgi:hypothetical protein